MPLKKGEQVLHAVFHEAVQLQFGQQLVKSVNAEKNGLKIEADVFGLIVSGKGTRGPFKEAVPYANVHSFSLDPAQDKE